jgi:hypothetical protein
MLAAVSAWAGGLANAVVDRAPGSVEVGKPFELVFRIQPVTPRKGSLEPTIKAVQGDRELVFPAVAMSGKNRYRAAVALPDDGEWTITVDSRFCHTRMKAVKVRAYAVTS